MSAPLDSVSDFDPTLEQVAAVNVALPPSGTRNTIPQPTGDAARVVLGAGTEFGQVCVYRQGDSLMVTAQGYGQLLIRNTPANGPNPPEVADTHGQVVRAESIGAGCGPPGGGLTDIAPAAGGANPAALAAVAPAAGPGPPGGEPSGGHFNSSFDPSLFLGLNYGPVDPLQFNRNPPILEPGPGATNPDELVQAGFDLLDMRSNNATADIPTADTPTWVPVGDPVDVPQLIADEGKSVYDTGKGNLVGAPDAANVQLLTGADVTITLLNENAGFKNITGYYTYDGGGNITGIQILWLNSAPDGGHTEADLYGKTGSLSESFHVDSPTNLGFFLLSDGGGDGTYTPFGAANKAVFDALFTALGFDPNGAGSSDAIVEQINAHLRFDPMSGTIQVDVDGNPNNGATGWTSLEGFAYFSHDSGLNTDAGQSNLTGDAASHTVSGTSAGTMIVGFEDLPFVGTANDPTAPTSFTPGPGYPGGVIPPDFDYNDTIFDVAVTYQPVEIAPGVWSPLTAIDNSLNNGIGSITQVEFTVAGLGGGVTINDLASVLSAGWTLNHGPLDADGNGTYTLLPPGTTASSAAFVSELAKLEIDVSASTSTAHPNVTIDFTATDSNGLTDTSHSVLDFGNAGNAPPAPPEVHVDAGPIPPPSPTIEQLVTP